MRKLLTLITSLLLVISAAATPVYNASAPISLAPGQVFTLFNAETPTPGTGTTAASQQVALPTLPNSLAAFAIDGKFSGAPGAFEVDVQVAAVDADTNYQTIANGNVATVDATNNTFHLDAPSVIAKYVRLLVRTRTNSVSLTATITGAR